MVASENSNPHAVQSLLEQQVDTQNINGTSYLMYASEKGDIAKHGETSSGE